MRKFTLREIESIYTKKAYPLYYNLGSLNIFGIRSESHVPDKFDDIIGCIFTDATGKRKMYMYDATTDPGLHYLKVPMNLSGCAILMPGYYKKLWKIGLHKGSQGFIQINPCTVTRDFNKDNVLDFTTSVRESGIYGINLHGVTSDSVMSIVGKNSAGCQVVNRKASLSQLLSLGHMQEALLNCFTFSYALFEEKDLVTNT